MARFSPLREELRRALHEIRGSHLSPERAGAAVAIGLFIGSQPIFGLHTPLVIALCLWFRLDGAVAWIASNISNPLLVGPLLVGEIQVGAYVRTGAFLDLGREISSHAAVSRFTGHLFVGALFVGLGLAGFGFAIAWSSLTLKRRLFPNSAVLAAAYRLPANAPPWVSAVERVATRYAPADGGTVGDRSRFHYVRTKLLGDPIAALIANIEGEAASALGDVVDIGTGRGQLPILLLELGRATRAFGLDWDAGKIEAAQRAVASASDLASPLAAEFVVGDVRTAPVPPADTVLLIDVLHYFAIAEQDAILRAAALAVRPGGRLLVREADTERGLRSVITLMEERLFTALRFNRGERVHFRPARDLVARLDEAGLSCEVRAAWGKTPFSNVLIIARRPLPL